MPLESEKLWERFRLLRRRARFGQESDLSDYELAIRSGLARDNGQSIDWHFTNDTSDILQLEKVLENYHECD